MTAVEEKIGYEFRNPALLEQALTTPARRMDHPEETDNQRLEFLGDAVFGLLSADQVYAAYPDASEGRLTQHRANLVSGASFAAVAERIGLRDHLKRNAGAQPLAPRAKVLADTLEAVMGAVWLDGGFAAARTVFRALAIAEGGAPGDWTMNPKGFLQIRTQALNPPRQPLYRVLSIKGAAHAPVVTVRVSVPGFGSADATAGSKSAAEVAAAAALLARTEEGGKKTE